MTARSLEPFLRTFTRISALFFPGPCAKPQQPGSRESSYWVSLRLSYPFPPCEGLGLVRYAVRVSRNLRVSPDLLDYSSCNDAEWHTVTGTLLTELIFMRKLTATLCLTLAVLLGACESNLIKHSEISAYLEKGLSLSEFLAPANKFCSSKPALDSEETHGNINIKIYN